MKRIIISLGLIAAVAGAVTGVTIALFNDTETSAGNVFTAGSINLKVDHAKASYNGEECVGDCEEVGSNLIVNGGFETPDIPTGTWTVYPNGSLTSWNVESGSGLEIQDNVAGAPHSGGQHAELDSNNSSVISQNIPTEAGKQYRLRFWYSPRPNRPAGDNTIDMFVKVVSGGATIVSDRIGEHAIGGSQTVWIEYEYNFVAVDNNTKIMFSDTGANNSYGGYLDDISVYALRCGEYTHGGTCTLWGERDLGQGDFFWNFTDVKPGDWGMNLISLHVYSNDAYACLMTHDIIDQEIVVNDPEIEAGDDIASIIGELSQYIKVFVWEDANQNGSYDSGESVYAPENSPLSVALNTISLTASQTKYIGIAWCAGTQGINGASCDGSTMGNIAQSDRITASITAYAEQQRNNSEFSCRNVKLK